MVAETTRMTTIGVLFGMENVFPGALVQRINELRAPGVVAEFVQIGGVPMNAPCKYRVIIDRISHDIPFYRAYLKQAALAGTYVVNNPFWCERRRQVLQLRARRPARRGGAADGRAAAQGASAGHHRQVDAQPAFPLNWDEVFDYVGFPAFLKPFDGGGWRDVFQVKTREEFFQAYDQTRDAVHDAAAGGQLHRVLPLLRRRPEGRPRHGLRPAGAVPRALRQAPAGLPAGAASTA